MLDLVPKEFLRHRIIGMETKIARQGMMEDDPQMLGKCVTSVYISIKSHVGGLEQKCVRCLSPRPITPKVRTPKHPKKYISKSMNEYRIYLSLFHSFPEVVSG